MFIKKRERTDNFYQELQQRTLERLQELSGDVWTDFNIHDPGVTISDNMNYALFELQYKLDLPFRAFIGTDSKNDASKGIFSADFIFSPSIVTPDDYEQLFLERIQNLESCLVEFNDGYYTVRASVLPDKTTDSSENIKEALFVLFHENRNLCEDLLWEDIHVLTKSSGKRKKKQEDAPQVERFYEIETPEKPIRIQDYNSFQLDFPDAYGIGLRGLPQEASERNKAHVLQLKGYLLIMDFMLSHVTEQIQQAPQLISFKEPAPTGNLSLISIPEINKVVDRTKFRQHNQLLSTASIQNKKSGFIDILDTLYGEDTNQFFQDFQPPVSKLNYRSTLTEELPEMNRNRFRSFNKLNPTESTVVFKELFSLLHGKKIDSEIPVQELLKRLGLDLLPDAIFFDQYEVYLDIAPISGVFYNPIFNETPQNIPVHEMDWKEEYFSSLHQEISLIRRNAIFESFLLVGSNPGNYRMIQLSENGRWILVFRYPGKEEWMILGTYRTKEHLTRSANRLWALIRFLNPERHLFYVVEHRLLHDAYPKQAGEKDGNTISVVASFRFENQSINERLEELLRERLPAHLNILLYRVQPDYIYDFEQIYYHWREALASRKTKELIHFSESIRAFFRVSNPFVKRIQ